MLRAEGMIGFGAVIAFVSVLGITAYIMLGEVDKELPEVDAHYFDRVMDLLLEAAEEIQEKMFFAVANLFDLVEVDWVFLATIPPALKSPPKMKIAPVNMAGDRNQVCVSRASTATASTPYLPHAVMPLPSAALVFWRAAGSGQAIHWIKRCSRPSVPIPTPAFWAGQS